MLAPDLALGSAGTGARLAVLPGIEAFTSPPEDDVAIAPAVGACVRRRHAAGREMLNDDLPTLPAATVALNVAPEIVARVKESTAREPPTPFLRSRKVGSQSPLRVIRSSVIRRLRFRVK
jgi:hypothetical protein